MPQSANFVVGLIQMEMTADLNENLRRASDRIEQAAKKGAQVICLPELFRSQYFCQKEDVSLFDLAETIPGPTTEAIRSLARKHKVAVVAPVFEKRTIGLYHNSAAVIDADGSMRGLYRKMHIPDDPAFYEKFYFTPGDLGFQVFPTQYGNIGTLICWDQWYPEGARITTLMGAEVLFYPTAIGWHPNEKAQYGKAQRESWQIIQRSHAIANGVYVASVNRVGLEKLSPESAGLEFWGSSFIADPQGVIIAEASTDKEEIILGEINIAHMEELRRNWPFLRDRRIEAYKPITERFLDKE